MKILSVILSVWNFLKGNQKIFGYYNLKSLIKLKDIKTNDDKLSFFQVIANILEENFEETLDFYEEMKIIKDARKIMMSSIKENINNIEKGKKLLEKQIDITINEDLEGDKFSIKFKKNLEEICFNYEKIKDELFGKYCGIIY
jgi:hypothetical protein